MLELWEGDRCSARLPLGEERLRIGRDPGCEIVCQAPGISRVHAYVERQWRADRDHQLVDFSSANGLFWRDQRIRAIGLRHGDAVLLGSSLKGSSTPTLRYLHPPSPLERVLRVAGLAGLFGSTLLVLALLEIGRAHV